MAGWRYTTMMFFVIQRSADFSQNPNPHQCPAEELQSNNAYNALNYRPPPPVGFTPFSTVHYWNRRGGARGNFPMPGALSQFRDNGFFQAAFES